MQHRKNIISDKILHLQLTSAIPIQQLRDNHATGIITACCAVHRMVCWSLGYSAELRSLLNFFDRIFASRPCVCRISSCASCTPNCMLCTHVTLCWQRINLCRIYLQQRQHFQLVPLMMILIYFIPPFSFNPFILFNAYRCLLLATHLFELN